jgi:phospholipid/cholesterol/gamma-HCH transport system ATP-binding protein
LIQDSQSSSHSSISERTDRADGVDDADAAPIIRVRRLKTWLGGRSVHRNLDLDVRRGEVIGVVGGSGTGKSVLLRVVVGLIPAARGTIEIFGQDTAKLNAEQWRQLEARWGVLFQDGALFSSLTVAQNIEVPLKEHLKLPQHLMDEIAAMKIALVGLPPDAGAKYPAELSGGMRKRAALARALALDPELLFLDEPTAGLDPIGAASFDALIRDLQKSLGLTVFLVTHDLDTLITICDRIAVLVDKHIKIGTISELLQDQHPWIHSYFHGPRGRSALVSQGVTGEV